MTASWVSAFWMVTSAALVAMAALALFSAIQRRLWPTESSLFDDTGGETAFLFDGNRLLDATPQARALLPQGNEAEVWPGVLARLGPMFPGLDRKFQSLPQIGEVVLASSPDVTPPMLLRAIHQTGLTRLILTNAAPGQTQAPRDAVALAATQQEVNLCREAMTHAPALVWRENAEGAVIWANHAYIIRAVELLSEGHDLSWPLPRLFPDPHDRPGSGRVKLQLQGGSEWFELSRIPVDDATLCYAVSANAAVQAETILREFMQTLTKTFADLPIGLAIFDRSRVLQLFNPALADLTTLAPEFLIARPSLSAMLDALRSKAMLPEPRDYRSWRRQLTKVEEEAAQGVFEETWSLPGGQTYRVIGRPHPNGALAFMFEDISSEMIRTRRYRADLELGQSVIDAVEEGVAVFSQAGQLVMSNLAYSEIWQHDPAVLLSEAGIATLCAWWREHSAPSLIWDDALSFAAINDDRSPWEGEARLLDGRLLNCRFRPLAGGATLIAFRLRLADTASARPESLSGQRLSA